MSLPIPVGRQSDVLYLPAQGHIIVLGTAGSGKSTLAILRSTYLANAFTSSNERVLLVTFNKALATFLRSLSAGTLHSRVDIHTYHKFALGYLSRRKNSRITVLDPDGCAPLVRDAVIEAKIANGNHALYERPLELLQGEIEWIAKCGIRTASEYEEVERVGRAGTRIIRKDRAVIFDIYQRYLKRRAQTPNVYDWNDIATAVNNEFARDTDARLYKHVVIDEGQDFSPAMLRSLAAAIPHDGSLMFFGDVAQQIYGTRISWRSAGLSAHKIWRFEQNYRNSKQIAQLGLAIAQMPYFQGETDMVAPREPRADGPRPTLVKCSNEGSEFKLAFDHAISIHRTQSIAILMRNRSREADFIEKFRVAGVSVRKLHRNMLGWSTHPGVFTGTYHAAKGLEFDTVILPFCNASVLPDASRAAVLGSSEDAMSEEGRLLYVAVTRAKTNLILTYSGELTPLLPRDVNLYERVTRQ